LNFELLTVLEFIGTAFALLGVYLTTRQNIWCWAVSIIAILIYIYIFYLSKLYGDSGLQVFYLIMSFYGWYEWLYGGKNKTELTISFASVFQIALLLCIGATGTLALGYFLSHHTDSDIPYWDAATTSFGLVATWLMARKIMQHWFFWIIIDILNTGIYLFKGLHITSFQYIIFTLLALYGYLQWKRSIASVKI
jgi:nicotinamide mononucleotide transporter